MSFATSALLFVTISLHLAISRIFSRLTVQLIAIIIHSVTTDVTAANVEFSDISSDLSDGTVLTVKYLSYILYG